MTDEGRATVITILWTISFNAGLLIAAGVNKALGFMLMISATIIVALYLHEDGKIEAERRRRKRYEQDCERRAREAREENDKWAGH